VPAADLPLGASRVHLHRGGYRPARFEATGRVALVTGAGQGMGVGIARALAAQGAAVAVNDLHVERVTVVADELTAEGLVAIPAPFDVTDPAEALGPVDVLVNNAGVPEGMGVAPFRDLPHAEWRRYVELNLYGSMHCIRAVIDGMCEREWGRIVQISSGAGRTGLAFGVSLYGASKSGIEGFIRHLAMEVARKGVTANCLALGLMANTAGSDEALLGRMTAAVPVGRLGAAEDVGAAVVYLASAEASWLTGQTVDLNGGATRR
jgi:NAD(P)-dependent dehydrogenase (short-subunit alcohol dehydrogenase family)